MPRRPPLSRAPSAGRHGARVAARHGSPASLGIRCYTPAQLRAAYDLAPLYADGNDGSGQTVAIIDSFGSPTIQNDLDVFSDTYGLPHTTVSVIAPAGPIPPFDPNNADMIGWGQESTLDVEAVHLVAPGAHILLVETPVAETEGVTGFPEMIEAENYVIDNHLANVITQSFGATEQSFPTAGAAGPAQRVHERGRQRRDRDGLDG